MKYVGAHVSISGGVFNAPINAKKIGAKAFALFTKNQRQWDSKELSQNDIDKFNKNLDIAEIDKNYILPHDSYLINLGSSNLEKREKSLNAFIDELQRCKLLGLNKLNFHAGSHLKEISEEESLELISSCMNIALKSVDDVCLVIENTAGQGSNLGYKFEHLAYLIENSIDKNRVGVCIDTAHTFASGYDIRTEDSYQNTMNLFDKIVGFKYLKAMHLNDSKAKLGSKVDRHHSLGMGEIGLDTFKFIMNDKRMENIPLILETIDETIWDKEIAMLYSFVN